MRKIWLKGIEENRVLERPRQTCGHVIAKIKKTNEIRWSDAMILARKFKRTL